MSLKRNLGLDILSEKYAYATDETTGYTSARKIPDKWVATTCGYCSVGCGMFVGVKDGRAVAVRGNPAHPVNSGTLCPKGLAEHYTLEAPNRAKYPLLRQNGKLTRVSWDEALDAMVENFLAVQTKHGPQALGVISTGQLVTEEFYTLGKLVQLGFGTTQLRRQYHAVHVHRGLRLQAIVWQRRSAGRVRRSSKSGRHLLDRREHCRESPHPLPASRSQPAARP